MTLDEENTDEFAVRQTPEYRAVRLLSTVLCGCAVLWSCAIVAPQTVRAAAATGADSGELSAARTSQGDYVIENFHFSSGETLPELRLHYTTLGRAHHDAHGHVDNAVLILHDTGGSGRGFLSDRFAGVLFGKGQLLDASRYFVIFADAIGHGKSSKPSDGLHARFPQYDYEDMVNAQFALLTQGLAVDHLRLIVGTSMGCMHAWMWGESRPDFMDTLMPLACLPAQITGRDRLWRDLITEAIRADPQWLQGEYRSAPLDSLRTAAGMMLIAYGAPLQLHASLPTREAADEFLNKYLERELTELDANDVLYQIAAARDYDSSTGLEKIRATVMWINSGDDFVVPPELALAEREVRRLRSGRFILLPASDQTHGHNTFNWAAVWQQYLGQLLNSAAGSSSGG